MGVFARMMEGLTSEGSEEKVVMTDANRSAHPMISSWSAQASQGSTRSTLPHSICPRVSLGKGPEPPKLRPLRRAKAGDAGDRLGASQKGQQAKQKHYRRG